MSIHSFLSASRAGLRFAEKKHGTDDSLDVVTEELGQMYVHNLKPVR